MDSSCYKWTSLDPQKVYQQPTKKTHLLNWCRQWLKRKQKRHERRGEQERTKLKNHYVELKPKATRLTWITISGKTKDPSSVGRKTCKGKTRRQTKDAKHTRKIYDEATNQEERPDEQGKNWWLNRCEWKTNWKTRGETRGLKQTLWQQGR